MISDELKQKCKELGIIHGALGQDNQCLLWLDDTPYIMTPSEVIDALIVREYITLDEATYFRLQHE